MSREGCFLAVLRFWRGLAVLRVCRVGDGVVFDLLAVVLWFGADWQVVIGLLAVV